MDNKKFGWMIIIQWLAMGCFAQSNIPNQVVNQIDLLFEEVLEDGPGYMIGVIQDQKILFQKGYGLANLEYGIPITSKSVFNVASLSKQFTAAAVALLILDNRLSLEDSVHAHIPELPNAYRSIQVKHLMYMCSGLKEYYECQRDNGMDWSSFHFFSMDTAIAANFRHGELNFVPGSRWAYNNINFMLLARIVENITGKRLAEFTKERIFDPLGMRSTLINDHVLQPIPNRADGYLAPQGSNAFSYFVERGYIPNDTLDWLQIRRHSPHYAGSGVFTSLEDLIKWDENWYTHELVGPEFYELMHMRMTFEHDKTNDAFGLVLGDFNGEEIIWYDGRTLGYRAYMMRFPEHQVSIICLSNVETGPSPQTKAHKIVDILIDNGLLTF